MNIEKIKKLEDLKSEKNQISELISKKVIEQKRYILEKIKEDFETYFSNKSFNINHHPNGATANYGSLNITISLPKPEDAFFGAYSVIELLVTGNQRKTFKIIVNEKGTRPGMKSTVRILPNDEDARLDLEINDITEQIQELLNRKNEIDKIDFGYRVQDADEVKRNPYLKTADTKQFDNMKELLDSIFK